MTPVWRLRQHVGLTQHEFARRVGVTQSSLSEAERCPDGVSRELALAITDEFRRELKSLGYTIEDLLRGVAA